MLNRRDLALGLGAAFAAGPALANAPLAVEPPVIEGGRDVEDRLTIPVRIGESGQFDFVVDTGADSSVIAADVAERLGLRPGGPVMIHSVTGAALTPTVHAPPIRFGDETLPARSLPVIGRDRLGADGLLGIDVLRGRRLVMDFKRRRLQIIPSSDDRPLARYRTAKIPTSDRYGLLSVIDVRAERIGAVALVDTGGSVTIANQELARRMSRRGAWRGPSDLVDVYGVTQEVAKGEARTLSVLHVGGLRFLDVPVVVSDVHLFAEWNLLQRPAILLGADVLRLFSRVELDYGNRHLFFQLGQQPPTALA